MTPPCPSLSGAAAAGRRRGEGVGQGRNGQERWGGGWHAESIEIKAGAPATSYLLVFAICSYLLVSALCVAWVWLYQSRHYVEVPLGLMSNIYHTEPATHGKVLLHTSFGDIDIELWGKECPKACRNFVQLAMEGVSKPTSEHLVRLTTHHRFAEQSSDSVNRGRVCWW